ncbi:MAG: hypothetical protein A2017_09090 [Lentisphaerae bacterium GWF2_44_16]|nr:MAG: hypothetical protein A2017_09090 [Lentisphaerae bacterium GWF2_44_16]
MNVKNFIITNSVIINSIIIQVFHFAFKKAIKFDFLVSEGYFLAEKGENSNYGILTSQNSKRSGIGHRLGE